ncbi:MAG: hypothetical protein MZV64_20885 [Ignavibacteriales bacterium]|nr:hypothetical protein [Ignavibacteriales bacterium]
MRPCSRRTTRSISTMRLREVDARHHLHRDALHAVVAHHAVLRRADRDVDVVIGIAEADRALLAVDTHDFERQRLDQDRLAEQRLRHDLQLLRAPRPPAPPTRRRLESSTPDSRRPACRC